MTTRRPSWSTWTHSDKRSEVRDDAGVRRRRTAPQTKERALRDLSFSRSRAVHSSSRASPPSSSGGVAGRAASQARRGSTRRVGNDVGLARRPCDLRMDRHWWRARDPVEARRHALDLSRPIDAQHRAAVLLSRRYATSRQDGAPYRRGTSTISQPARAPRAPARRCAGSVARAGARAVRPAGDGAHRATRARAPAPCVP